MPCRNLVGKMAEQLKEEGIGNQLVGFVPQRDRNAYRMGAVGSQSLAALVDDITVLDRDLLNLLPGRRRDQRTFGERARHCRGRYASKLGDVGHLQRRVGLTDRGDGLGRWHDAS